jgi:hypothetical protein
VANHGQIIFDHVQNIVDFVMSVIIFAGLQVISMFITKDENFFRNFSEKNWAFLGIPFEFFTFLGILAKLKKIRIFLGTLDSLDHVSMLSAKYQGAVKSSC